jgi:hypothetical protein
MRATVAQQAQSAHDGQASETQAPTISDCSFAQTPPNSSLQQTPTTTMTSLLKTLFANRLNAHGVIGSQRDFHSQFSQLFFFIF